MSDSPKIPASPSSPYTAADQAAWQGGAFDEAIKNANRNLLTEAPGQPVNIAATWWEGSGEDPFGPPLSRDDVVAMLQAREESAGGVSAAGYASPPAEEERDWLMTVSGGLGALSGAAEAVAGGVGVGLGGGAATIGIVLTAQGFAAIVGIPLAIKGTAVMCGGAVVMAHGMDVVQANYETAVTGKFVETETSKMGQELFGWSKDVANRVDTMVSVVGSFGIAGLSSLVAKTPLAANVLVTSERAAASEMAAVGLVGAKAASVGNEASAIGKDIAENRSEAAPETHTE